MKRKLVPLMLLPLLALTSCGEITNRPTNYEDPLIALMNGDKVDVYNNINKIIYDAKLDGGVVAKEVLNDVLLTIAESVFGTYEELTDAAKLEASSTEFQTFVNQHKVYWILDSKGERKANEGAKELQKVKLQAQRLEERIANKFFDAIKGSFTRDGYFYESDYLMSLVSTLKNVEKPTELGVGLLISPEFDGKDVFNPDQKFINSNGETVTTSLLHKENYDKKNADGKYINDYLRNDIVNEIYRELLVEQYLFESNYSAISRAYAREVEIVTITNRDEAPLAANNLMNAYVDKHINGTAEDAKVGLSAISQAWRGTFEAESAAEQLIKDAKFETVKYDDTDLKLGIENVESYLGTSKGALVNKLNKLSADPKATDTTIESEFTNNGEHTIKEGYEDQLIKVQQENYITDGWHLRNGGLSSLNEKMRTRLFNIGVANALDNENYPDRFSADGKYNNHPEGEIDENPYVAKINGRYFLKPATTEKPSNSETKIRDMVWFDEAANSFTIVEIKNAVSSAKLAKDNDDNYENRYGEEGFEKMETVSHAVAYELAKGDSYRSLSTKHWLKATYKSINDQEIRDYFEENYPEIFEE